MMSGAKNWMMACAAHKNNEQVNKQHHDSILPLLDFIATSKYWFLPGGNIFSA